MNLDFCLFNRGIVPKKRWLSTKRESKKALKQSLKLPLAAKRHAMIESLHTKSSGMFRIFWDPSNSHKHTVFATFFDPPPRLQEINASQVAFNKKLHQVSSFATLTSLSQFISNIIANNKWCHGPKFGCLKDRLQGLLGQVVGKTRRSCRWENHSKRGPSWNS